MTIRKFLLCLLALGAMSSVSLLQAQDEKKGKGGGRGGMTVERIEEAVGTLTAAQKTKIEAILAKVRDQIQAVPQEERQAKGRELRQASNAEIRAVLTDEQKKKFDEMAQQGRGGGKKKDQ
jgi:periplasmic protein CpxP/Spy